MAKPLVPFPNRGSPILQIFCPSPEVVITSFEDYLPGRSAIGNISGTDPGLPARLSWLKDGFDYYAYLPKDLSFDGHLLTALKYCKPEHVERGGRWYVDDKTRELWQCLDINLTRSIDAIGGGMLLTLAHQEPTCARSYGFTRGHKTSRGLSVSLAISKNAFIHRLSYLTYLVSCQYQWDQELGDQMWWKQLTGVGGPAWVDGVWDAIYRQWFTRNFVGVVAQPSVSSVRWLGPALRFGVPVWVSFPSPQSYQNLDGGFVMKAWTPSIDQVRDSRMANKAGPTTMRTGSPSSPSLPPTNSPPEMQGDPTLETQASLIPQHFHQIQTPPSHLSPPAKLPTGTTWHESWEDFFQTREEANNKRFEYAPGSDQTIWNSRAQNARSFSPPGKRGQESTSGRPAFPEVSSEFWKPVPLWWTIGISI